MKTHLSIPGGPAIDDKSYVENGLLEGKNPLKIIDLFAGIGGFHYGIAAAAAKVNRSVKPVFVSEIDRLCRETYRSNHHVTDVLGDINEINLPDFTSEKGNVDLVTAGFPCQPFSNSGKKLGLSDPRGHFFFRIEEIINFFGAKAFILENVPGMTKNGGGQFESQLAANVQHIGSTMHELERNLLRLSDYQIIWFELNTCDLGSPQVRKRIYIVGIQNDVLNGQDFEIKINRYQRKSFIRIAENSAHFPQLHLSERQEQNLRSSMGNSPSYKDGMRRVGKAYLCDGGNVGQGYHAYGMVPTLTKVWARFLPIYFPGENEIRPDVRSRIFEPDHLYKSGSGFFRRASVREVKKLQGFPVKFKPHERDHIAYEQFGNAVNAKAIREIADNILRYLK